MHYVAKHINALITKKYQEIFTGSDAGRFFFVSQKV
jgi:hypothetical protein